MQKRAQVTKLLLSAHQDVLYKIEQLVNTHTESFLQGITKPVFTDEPNIITQWNINMKDKAKREIVPSFERLKTLLLTGRKRLTFIRTLEDWQASELVRAWHRVSCNAESLFTPDVRVHEQLITILDTYPNEMDGVIIDTLPNLLALTHSKSITKLHSLCAKSYEQVCTHYQYTLWYAEYVFSKHKKLPPNVQFASTACNTACNIKPFLVYDVHITFSFQCHLIPIQMENKRTDLLFGLHFAQGIGLIDKIWIPFSSQVGIIAQFSPTPHDTTISISFADDKRGYPKTGFSCKTLYHLSDWLTLIKKKNFLLTELCLYDQKAWDNVLNIACSGINTLCSQVQRMLLPVES